MIEFYSPDIETSLILPESDSAHCVRVLRMKEGDELTVVDGHGGRFRCVLIEAHAKHAGIQILEREQLRKNRDFSLTLAVAPTKHTDRMEWLLEKAVEIGIDRIVLLRCARSERKNMNLERLEKVMISAMKQSLKAYLPQLEGIIPFKDFLRDSKIGPSKFFGYCAPDFPKKNFVEECPVGRDVCIMIGPEGDFSADEVDMAVKEGFMPVTFGENRLRTETAALYGVTAVHVVNQLKK